MLVGWHLVCKMSEQRSFISSTKFEGKKLISDIVLSPKIGSIQFQILLWEFDVGRESLPVLD